MVDIDLERLKASRVFSEFLGPVLPSLLTEEVSAGAVRIQQYILTEVSSKKFRDRLVKYLPRQIPQCDIDSAQDADLPSPLRVRIEHIVKMYPNRQRVLAD